MLVIEEGRGLSNDDPRQNNPLAAESPDLDFRSL
jgi:hypothetical protein